ncbi:MAG: YceI family protein [Deltaproteobacteria bacterium]|nr:MAG: YceI family protein [Deltaproteobacteria bacterium]
MKNANRTLLYFLAAAALLLVACPNPARDVPAATLEEAEAETAEPSADEGAEPAEEEAGEPEVLAISHENSRIDWVGSKVTGSHDGGFREFSGTLTLHPTHPTRSSIDITIDATSIWSDDDRLTGHLRNDDFFDVENHPTAAFRTTEIREGAEGEATHVLVGDLTMRGTTQRISFPATVTITDEAVNANAEFSINRMDFGVSYAGMANDLIRPEVVIRLQLEAPRG